MKNKQLETVLILLFIGIILTGYSFFRPELSISFLKGENVNLNFIPFEKIQSLSLTEVVNDKADQITDNLIAKADQADTVATTSSKSIEKEEETPTLSMPNTIGKGGLDDFFSALQFEAPKKVVRIAHYGDSQIEGDRITSNLRKKFIAKFGGEGVGFIPLDDIAECVSYTRKSSNHWKKYTVFHDKLKNGIYGLSGMSFIFKSEPSTEDVETQDENTETENTNTNKASISLSLRNNYSHFSIQYGNASSPCKMIVRGNGNKEIIGKTMLTSSEDYTSQEVILSKNEKQLNITFSGKSPMIFGLSIDGDKGVQVDNYGIRGHSGNGLMKINNQLFAKEIQQSNTRLMILQFGANTIPYVKNEKTLNYVAQEFSKLFKKFKGANPNISILVIGVGDMATRIDGEYTSYPMIPQIRDVLKKSALDAGCAYFDMYEYMGGKDAILTWSKKKLASKDGHFSPQGQEIVADEIYRVILIKYNQFVKKYHLNT